MSLQERIREVINCVSAENGSDTPDFILAEYLTDCLAAWDKGVKAREKWYGRESKLCQVDSCPSPPNNALCVKKEGGDD